MINPLRYHAVLDLGTETTRIALQGTETILEEPSAVAMTAAGIAAAAGEEAVALAEKEPGIYRLVRPVRGGAVSDAKAAGEMVRLLVKKIPTGWMRGWGLALVPTASSVSEVERRAVEQAARLAGAGDAWLEDAGWAAALGCGLPLDRPQGSMVVDIGAGVTTAAVYSLEGRVAERAAAVGAGDWDESIAAYIRREHHVAVNEHTAREIKHQLADVYAPRYEEVRAVRGRDLHSGLPVTLDIGATEMYQALEEDMDRLFEVVTACLAETPPELAADVLKTGVTLCGGGCQLKGLPQRLGEALGLPVRRAEEPTSAAVRGGKILLDRGLFYLQRKANISMGRRGHNG